MGKVIEAVYFRGLLAGLFRTTLHVNKLYVCSMYGHHMYLFSVYSLHDADDVDQPGKDANLARGQLNRENEYYFPFPVRAEKLASRDGFGCPVPRQPAHSPYSG